MTITAGDCFPIPCITFDEGLLETLPIIAVIGFLLGVAISHLAHK